VASVIQAQNVAVKSNIVYDATGTLNLGAEYAINKKFSVDLSGNYNGWDLKSDGTSWQHYMIQPEFRYWMLESFNGHFFGVHGMYMGYNLARLELPLFDFQRKYMYDGSAFGGGVSYGYQLYITPRLNVEFSLGVGYASFEYDKILYREKELDGRYTKSYFGLTKLGISIVYIIN
jgi:hypothetical protein